MNDKKWYIDYQTAFMDFDMSMVKSIDRKFDKAQVDNIVNTMTKIVNKKLKELCKKEAHNFRPEYSDLEFELRLEGCYSHDPQGSLMVYVCVFGEGRHTKERYILDEIKKAIEGSQSLKDMGLVNFIYEFTG